MKYNGSYNEFLNMSEINHQVIQWLFVGDDFEEAFRYDNAKKDFLKIWKRLNEVDSELSDKFEKTDLVFMRAENSELKFSFDKLKNIENKSGKATFAAIPKIIIKLAKDFSVGIFSR